MRTRISPILLIIAGFLCSFGAIVFAVEKTCEENACEEIAPYVLRIIKSGENDPRSSNTTAEGRQDNRRTDVTLTRRVPLEKINRQSQTALFKSGGAVWISKDPSSLDRILTVKAPTSVIIENGIPESTVKFNLHTNYAAFIEKLEVLIWEEGASSYSDPIFTQQLNASWSKQQWDWEDSLPDIEFNPDTTLFYALRATDAEGRIDQTFRKPIEITLKSDNAKPTSELPEVDILNEADNEDGDYAKLERQGILIAGSKVRITGQDMEPSSTVKIDGREIELGEDGRFGIEYLLPTGTYDFDVSVKNGDVQVVDKELSIDLDGDYLFMVAMADVTAGKNSVSGSIEPLAVDSHHYGGDIFVDGRLAFYLKGKVRGKYLITAQMDTGTENINELFSDFHRKDPQSIFSRLDPDQYYPVYGDNSQLIDDTNSQGKLYVRVDWDRSQMLWGNYNTNFTGTELAPFNRSLYGAQLMHKSPKDTSLGDETYSLNVFASKSQSLFRHNEFLSTGGSLYYLRDTDIVTGSEKVWVEVRQAGSERVTDKIVLVAGRDYEMDDFQGRIILKRPLLSVATQGEPSIIRDEPLAGNQTFLIVDYEYSPTNLEFSDATVGARVKTWLSDHVGVGGTWAHEQRDGNDYDIRGVDLTLKRSEQTFIKGEYAQSDSSQTSGSFASDNGGLSFTPFISNNEQSSGSAFGFEARISLSDWKPESKQFEIGAWLKNQDKGFSTANTDTGIDIKDAGIELVAKPKDKLTVYTRASKLEKVDESSESIISSQLVYNYSDKIDLSGELRNKKEKNYVAGSSGETSLVAGKVSMDYSDALNLYGITQYTIKNSGADKRNNSATIGAKYKATERIGLTGELSSGDRGNSVLFGTDVNVSDTYSLYTNYTYSFNRGQVEKNSLVVGQRKTVNSQLKIYTEHQFTREESRKGYSNMIGLDQKLSEHSTATLSLQKSVFENPDGTNTERNTATAGLAYQKKNVRFNSKIEYRLDESFGIETQQWVTANKFEYRKTPSFRWQGRFNASITDDRIASDDARFVELGIGFALRPVANDRLNMLGRLTYLSDLQPRSQSNESDQRSVIASIEGLYDITKTWSAGAKLAHRSSEIRLQRNSGDWIDNDASLISARARYKANFGIDATVAYHWLLSGATEGTRQGALLSVGRRVGNNLNLAVGYNFTSFDDNLINDSYDVSGWFINLIGTY